MNKLTICFIVLLVAGFHPLRLFGKGAKEGDTVLVSNSTELLQKMGLLPDVFQIIKIKGDTTIIYHKESRILKSLIFRSLIIPYKIKFSCAGFDSVSVRNCRFAKDIIFDSCTIRSFFNIETTIFGGGVDFYFCRLPEGNPYFSRSLFRKYLNFEKAHSPNSFIVLDNSVLFDDLTISGDSIDGFAITGSKLFQKANFLHISTRSEIMLEFSEIRDEILIYNAHIDAALYFTGIKFWKELDINDCRIDDKIEIYDEILPDVITVKNLTLPGVIDFSGCLPNLKLKKSLLYIGNESINKVIPNISCELAFTEDVSEEFRNETYRKFLQNLKERGYEELYQRFDLDYKKFYFVDYKNQRLWYLVQKQWWNFGYDKYRVIFNTVLILLVFSVLIFFTNTKEYVDNEYHIKTLSSKYRQNRGINVHPLRIVANYVVALIFTANIFFRFGLKLEDMKFSSYFRSLIIIVIYIVGLICTAFIFNFIITAK